MNLRQAIALNNIVCLIIFSFVSYSDLMGTHECNRQTIILSPSVVKSLDEAIHSGRALPEGLLNILQKIDGDNEIIVLDDARAASLITQYRPVYTSEINPINPQTGQRDDTMTTTFSGFVLMQQDVTVNGNLIVDGTIIGGGGGGGGSQSYTFTNDVTILGGLMVDMTTTFSDAVSIVDTATLFVNEIMPYSGVTTVVGGNLYVDVGNTFTVAQGPVDQTAALIVAGDATGLNDVPGPVGLMVIGGNGGPNSNGRGNMLGRPIIQPPAPPAGAGIVTVGGKSKYFRGTGGDGIDATGGDGDGQGGSAGNGLMATGGNSTDPSGHAGAGAVITGGTATNVGGVGAIITGADAVGGTGGDGVVAVAGSGFTGGTGVSAQGGDGAGIASFGGNGVTAVGGANNDSSGTAGIGVSATGGIGNVPGASGGVGVLAQGGSAFDTGNGGIGVTVAGGAAGANGAGGIGATITGGQSRGTALTGPIGVQIVGGAGTGSTAAGGVGIDVQGGSGNGASGGIGIVCRGGSGSIPGFALEADGNVTVTGSLLVQNFAQINRIYPMSPQTFTELGGGLIVDLTATFSSDVTIQHGAILHVDEINPTSGHTTTSFSGSIDIMPGGNLTVEQGNVTMSQGNLSMLNGNLLVDGNETLTGDLLITGSIRSANANNTVVIKSGIEVTGAATFDSITGFDNTVTIQNGTSLHVNEIFPVSPQSFTEFGAGLIVDLTSTFSSDVTIQHGGILYVDEIDPTSGHTTTSFSGSIDIMSGGNLIVEQGNVTMSQGSLTLSQGNLTLNQGNVSLLNGTLLVDGNETLTGDLVITGSIRSANSNNTVVIKSGIEVTGAATFDNTASFANSVTIQNGTSLFVNKISPVSPQSFTEFGSGLIVDLTSTFSGALTLVPTATLFVNEIDPSSGNTTSFSGNVYISTGNSLTIVQGPGVLPAASITGGPGTSQGGDAIDCIGGDGHIAGMGINCLGGNSTLDNVSGGTGITVTGGINNGTGLGGIAALMTGGHGTNTGAFNSLGANYTTSGGAGMILAGGVGYIGGIGAVITGGLTSNSDFTAAPVTGSTGLVCTGGKVNTGTSASTGGIGAVISGGLGDSNSGVFGVGPGGLGLQVNGAASTTNTGGDGIHVSSGSGGPGGTGIICTAGAGVNGSSGTGGDGAHITAGNGGNGPGGGSGGDGLHVVAGNGGPATSGNAPGGPGGLGLQAIGGNAGTGFGISTGSNGGIGINCVGGNGANATGATGSGGDGGIGLQCTGGAGGTHTGGGFDGNTGLALNVISNPPISGTFQGGTFVNSSDKSVKTDIESIDPKDSLSKVLGLTPRTFKFTESFNGIPADEQQTQRGFIAQEVKQVLPELIMTSPRTVNDQVIKEFHYLDYAKLVTDLVGALQAAYGEHKTLAKDHEELKKMHAQTLAQLVQLQSKVEDLGKAT